MNIGEEPSIFELLSTVCSKLSVASMCKHNPVSEATAGKEFLNFLVLAAVTSKESDKKVTNKSANHQSTVSVKSSRDLIVESNPSFCPFLPLILILPCKPGPGTFLDLFHF